MVELQESKNDCLVNGEVTAELVGTAPAFLDVVSRLPALAAVDAPVLVSGETGTGKRIVACAIHRLSPRAARPFVAVNCGSFVDTLLEDEPFGHERGAHTDAHARRQGLIASAAGGTLFLGEADTLTPRAQVALLRVLQDHAVRPLGTSSEQHIDVRFMAATHADLYHLVQADRFRADLYYRLCVLSVNLPPLRERGQDILPLATHFLAKHARTSEPAPKLSAASIEACLAFDWPGNVRELESAMVRGIQGAKSGVIEVSDLRLPRMDPAAQLALPAASRSYKAQKQRVLEAFHRQYLVRLMLEHKGNVTHAAREAGKERRDLGKLLKRHGLNPKNFAR